MGHITRRKKGGNYQAVWTGVDGERHRKSTHTSDPQAARQRLREYERATSVWRPPPFTVLDACTLAGQVQLAKGNSPEWRERCAEAVTMYLLPLLGADTDLNAAVIPRLVDEYVLERRKKITPSGKPTSDGSIRKELLIVRQGSKRGQRYKRFYGDLDEFIPETLQAGYQPRSVRLTIEQARRLMEVATPHRQDWLLWAMHTGLDPAPTHRITREHFDFELGKYGVVYAPDRKNEYREDRPIPLSAEVRRMVDRRFADDVEYLFRPIWTPQQFRVCMERWCPLSGVGQRIRWKDLRRTHASFMGDAGAAPAVIGKLLGHAPGSKITDQVYMHAALAAREEAISMLPSLVPDMCQATVVQLRKDRESSGASGGDESENPAENAG